MRYLVEPGWLQPGPFAFLFLVVIGVLLPWGALRQHRRMAAGTLSPGRVQVYTSAIGTHAMFLLIVWAVVWEQGVHFFPRYTPSATHLAIGLVALAIGLVPLFGRFTKQDPVAKERTRLIAPRTAREHGLFYLVCITAGVAEELTYRGVLFTLLARLLGGWWMGALAAALLFGIVHLFQGWQSAGIAALMGLREQLVVGLTGTLFVAIVVHILHDAVAGAVISRRARREEGMRGDGTVAV